MANEATPSSPRHRVFVAFAGGGAKGLIHVGALCALEDRDVEFRGLAGTSAGAIVAALKAAGFSSRDMFDVDGGRSLIDKLNEIDDSIKRPTDIFGPGGWDRVLWFRWAMGHFRLLITLTILVGLTMVMGMLSAGASRSWPLIIAVIGLALGSGMAIFFLGRGVIGGLANLERFRSALAVLLQRKMFPGDPERVVTLGDFAQEGRPTLKIVGSDLSRRRLQLFSPERTPNIAVADAVAASICLPIVFVPWRIGETTFVDGGLVSNLPAWPFDEERELDPEALTIAVEIADTSNASEVGRFSWFSSAVRTALFGSGELNLRAAGQAEQLVLESSLDLLQFDLTVEEARQEVQDANSAASVRLDKRLFRRPELYRNACEVTRGLAEDVLETALEIAQVRVRVAIAVPDRDYHYSLRLRFSSGYEADPDEGMLLPISGSLLGVAWTARESRFEVAPFPQETDLPGEANRLRRNRQWPKLAWQLCIPILDKDERPRIAVHLGGDTKLSPTPRLEEAVTEIESSVKEFFNLIMEELAELEEHHGLEEHNIQEV